MGEHDRPWNPETWELESGSVELPPELARRIVACLKFCEGVPTEVLEDGTIHDMVHHAFDISAEHERNK